MVNLGLALMDDRQDGQHQRYELLRRLGWWLVGLVGVLLAFEIFR